MPLVKESYQVKTTGGNFGHSAGMETVAKKIGDLTKIGMLPLLHETVTVSEKKLQQF